MVAKLRGILHQKKIGHTGTLDPDAVGVLPVCLGRGTKLCDMLTDKDKVYEAELLLGMETDTQDISGVVVNKTSVEVTEQQVYEAVMSFVGSYDQIPPMYSAIKVDGKKLYELAREGKSIERVARKVDIYNIKVEEIKLPYVKMTVHCSKGTYIRTLCHDIGKKLGCHGCMFSLKRTRVSCFTDSRAITLEKVAQYVNEGRIEEHIMPIDRLFENYPAFYDDGRNEKLLNNGNEFYPNGKVIVGKVRVYRKDNTFIGIYQYNQKKDMYSPIKVFYNALDN